MTRSPLGSVVIWYSSFGGWTKAESGAASAATSARSSMKRRRTTIAMIWGPLPADEAETGAQPAQRRRFEWIGVDAPFARHEQLDGAARPLEADAAFHAAARLGAAIAAAVNADQPQIRVGYHADMRVHGHFHINAAVRLP